ncbi:MAG: hypothetical protein H7288_00180 [Kineosporiaceae bacterium]|nr:hypothetical protein [Aeromicrobium sp.]
MGEASQEKPDPQTIEGNQTMGHVKLSPNSAADPSLQNTLQDVLADERARGLGRERRSGLTLQEQRVLLDEIDA